jgi:hypothetical protein
LGIIADIVGFARSRSGAEPAARPATIADVEASLARLAAERNGAREAVAAARAERDALLIEDQTDDRIAALDAAIERHHLALERCDKLEPILVRELQSLRAEARRRQFEGLCRRYEVAGRQFAASFRGALEGRVALIAIREEAGNFAAERDALLPAPPFMTTPELSAAWDASMDKLRDAMAPKAAPAKAPAAPNPAPTVENGNSRLPGQGSPVARPQRPAQPAAKAAPPPTPAPTPPPAPFSPTVDGEDRCEITVTKAGFDLRDGSKTRLGEKLTLPREEALALVRATVAEFTEYDQIRGVK